MPEMRALRDALIARLEAAGTLRSPRIAAAMRAVARERFIPEFAAAEAYADRALALKAFGGTVVSSISQPSIVAEMLELLDACEGSRILEIGTGSGYNAALLAMLAGPDVVVTSVEIDTDLARRAQMLLTSQGFERVRILMDGELADDDARYDRIIVTARARDIDARWWRRLEDGGRLVVPLDLGYGGEHVIAFQRRGLRLMSDGSRACAFVALRGANDAQPAIFFRKRIAPAPSSDHPIAIVAIERENAQPSFLEEGDAVVAQTHTLFALTRA